MRVKRARRARRAWRAGRARRAWRNNVSGAYLRSGNSTVLRKVPVAILFRPINKKKNTCGHEDAS